MDNSILSTVKKMLGISEDDHSFDTDIVVYINSVFTTLQQMGVGPTTGFYIEDDSTFWNDYISDQNNLNLIKNYMYSKVRLMFDPPSSSQYVDILNKNISEMEWRINYIAETTSTTSTTTA